MTIWVIIAFSFATLVSIFYFLYLINKQFLLVRINKLDTLIQICSVVPCIINSFLQKLQTSFICYSIFLVILIVMLPIRLKFANLLTLNIIFASICSVCQCILTIISIYYKKINVFDTFFILSSTLQLSTFSFIVLGIAVRKSRFKFILSQLPKIGQDFYKKYAFFIPSVKQSPFLEQVQWLQLARITVLVQCKKKFQFKIIIKRKTIYQDTIQILFDQPLTLLKYPLYIRFENEMAIDTGGLKNEFITLLAEQLFKNQAKKNIIYNEEGLIFLSNSCSTQNSFLIGWLLGKSLYHNVAINFNISNLLLSVILDQITLQDIEQYDYHFAKLITDSEKDQSAYQMFIDLLGQPKFNKFSHKIDLLSSINLRYFKDSPNIVKFLQRGFFSAFPQPASNFLSVQLLSTIISTQILNVQDWRDNSIIKCTFDLADIFFDMLDQYPEMRSDILRFSTGLKNVPNNTFQWLGKPLFSGESTQQFRLEGIHKNLLPMSSTCAFTLKIPYVDNIDILKQRFLIALQCEDLDQL